MRHKLYLFIFFSAILLSSAQDAQKAFTAADKIMEEHWSSHMMEYRDLISTHNIFKERFSTAELLTLIDHPNLPVKYFSFWVLSEDHSQNLLPCIAKYVKDSTILEACHVCHGNPTYVGDIFINLYTQPGIDRKQSLINPSNQKYLDSLTIFSPLPLQSKNNALGRVNGYLTWYPRIRELVVTHNYQLAIRALAIYQKQEDIQVIKSLRSHEKTYPFGVSYMCYDVIRLFPDTAFKKDLEEDIAQILKNKDADYNETSLCCAIAAYRDDWAKNLLTNILNTTRTPELKERSGSIVSMALAQHADTTYNTIRWQLWEKERRIDAAALKQLQKSDAERCYRNARKTAANVYSNDLAPDFIYYLSSKDSVPENIYTSLLKVIRERDPKAEVEIICKEIVNADRLVVSVYVNETILRKDKAFVEPLLTRLGKEDDQDVYHPLIKTLLEYKDDTVNKKLIAVLRKNPNLSDVLEGNYNNAIPVLLTKYKVK